MVKVMKSIDFLEKTEMVKRTFPVGSCLIVIHGDYPHNAYADEAVGVVVSIADNIVFAKLENGRTIKLDLGQDLFVPIRLCEKNCSEQNCLIDFGYGIVAHCDDVAARMKQAWDALDDSSRIFLSRKVLSDLGVKERKQSKLETLAERVIDNVSDGYDDEEYRERDKYDLAQALYKSPYFADVLTALCERIEDLQ